MLSITDIMLFMEYIKFLLIVAAFLAEYPIYLIGTKSVMAYCWIEI